MGEQQAAAEQPLAVLLPPAIFLRSHTATLGQPHQFVAV